MRILMMHKNDPHTEAGDPPSPEIITKMGAFIGEHAQSRRFVDGAGLTGSKNRTRLVFKGGQPTVKHGPYRGEHELPAAMMQLKVATRDEAIGWAERYGKILGDGEIDPKVVDYAHLPAKLDEPTLRAGLAADEKKLRDLGYNARWLLIDRGETAESVVSAALAKESFDCILVGAGIRTIEPLYPLFEKLVNVLHAKAPNSKIAFNNKPDDTAESVQRWVSR